MKLAFAVSSLHFCILLTLHNLFCWLQILVAILALAVADDKAAAPADQQVAEQHYYPGNYYGGYRGYGGYYGGYRGYGGYGHGHYRGRRSTDDQDTEEQRLGYYGGYRGYGGYGGYYGGYRGYGGYGHGYGYSHGYRGRRSVEDQSTEEQRYGHYGGYRGYGGYHGGYRGYGHGGYRGYYYGWDLWTMLNSSSSTTTNLLLRFFISWK